MQTGNQGNKMRFGRGLAWCLLCWLALVTWCTFSPEVWAESQTVAESPLQQESFFVQVARNLFNSRGLLEILKQPQFTVAAFLVLNAIIFVETGLFFGFFLPGDSLLVTAGVACYMAEWNLPLLLVTLCLSAIIGDSIGYSIGYQTGPKIFKRERSWFFNKDHLLKAQEFYDKHGGKTIILARFVPIIRTFAPVVAGVAKMHYPRFLSFNIFGGIGWVVSMVLIGYYLTLFINPPFQRLLGNPNFDVKDHIEKVILIVVFLSISPGIYVWLKKKLGAKAKTEPALVEAGK